MSPVSQSNSVFAPPVNSYLEIKGYIQHILTHSGEGAWDMLSKHIVSKLEHRKNFENGEKPEHEDIVATIVDPHGSSFRMIIGRFKSTAAALATGGGNTAEISPTPFLSRFVSFDSANSGTSASMPEGSQDSLQAPSPAYDVVSALPQGYKRPLDLVVLRVFEPPAGHITLFRLATIIESVHNHRPNYQIFRSQCYWFALTIMGISMLQGGRVKILGKEGSKQELEPDWKPLGGSASLGQFFPKALGLSTSEYEQSRAIDDVATLRDGAGAGNNGKFPIVRVSLPEIQTIGIKAQKNYDRLQDYLDVSRKATEAEAIIQAMKEDAKESSVEFRMLKEALEESEKENAAYKKQIEELRKEVGDIRLGNGH